MTAWDPAEPPKPDPALVSWVNRNRRSEAAPVTASTPGYVVMELRRDWRWLWLRRRWVIVQATWQMRGARQ